MTKYSSNYTDRKVTAGQKAAEIMCERRATQSNVELPEKFWSISPAWKQYYFYQLTLAYPLIEKYGEKKVLGALNEPEYSILSSLNSDWFKNILNTYKVKPKLNPENIKVNKVIDNKKLNRSNKIEDLLDG